MRITIIFALLVTLVILLRSGINAWQFTPGPGPQQGETVPAPVFHERGGAVDLSSVVPQPLPDLHKGYLFNAERSLVIEEAADLEPEADKEGTTDIDFDTVSYAGSIITGDLRKALVTYAVSPTNRYRSRSAAIRSRTTRTAQAAASQIKHAQLVLGDTFNGYKVVDIKAEKIIFQRDEEQIEKLLHDSAKERMIVASPIAGLQREKPAAVATPGSRQIPAGPPDQDNQPAPAEPTAKAPSDITPAGRQPAAVPERRPSSNPRRRLRSIPSAAAENTGR